MSARHGTLSRLARMALIAVLPAVIAVLPAVGRGQTSPPAPAAGPADPVVAKVNGQAIHLSDVSAAARSLPPNLQGMPPQQIYPRLLDGLVNQIVLADAARKAGVDKDPQVERQVTASTDRVLANALLTKEVLPTITEQALRARFAREIADKPPQEEVHAKHILVDSEVQAKAIIAELNKGADFSALAKKYSKDPGAADGGDLGFFKRDEMMPAFSDAAFALQPGQFTQTPVHTQFGWHVILVVARRKVPQPTFEQARDELRQEMVREGVQKEIMQARSAATVVVFNPDGSPRRDTDTAVPPAK
jgi:peptidyl-prolyl cis-trans isomerase C